ncbi:MAG: BrnT family toxin [Gemmatimonadota bacterium]|nr:BrnT family toxin [Gemmatimonadota bacterium]
MEFRWNEWNEGHISEHGVDPQEAEEVVRRARSPYPLVSTDDKFLVWAPTADGRLLQVVFLVDDEDSVFVIQARPLTEKEKRRYRRRLR